MRPRPVLLFDSEDLAVRTEAFEAEDFQFTVDLLVQQQKVDAHVAFAISAEIALQFVVLIFLVQGDIVRKIVDDRQQLGIEDFAVASFLFALTSRLKAEECLIVRMEHCPQSVHCDLRQFAFFGFSHGFEGLSGQVVVGLKGQAARLNGLFVKESDGLAGGKADLGEDCFSLMFQIRIDACVDGRGRHFLSAPFL